MNRPHPSSVRWKLSGAIGPELVAVGLILIIGLVVLMLSALGVLPGRPDDARPSVSPAASLAMAWRLAGERGPTSWVPGRSTDPREVPSDDRPQKRNARSEQPI